MVIRKIAGPMLVFSGASAGAFKTYSPPPAPGGMNCNRARYEVLVTAVKNTEVKISVRMRHGPDGQVHVAHSTPIASTQVTSLPVVLGGDVDSTKMIGEWIHPKVDVDTTNAETWAMIEIYEIRKAFR